MKDKRISKTMARKEGPRKNCPGEKSEDSQNLAALLRFEHDGMGIAPKE